MPKSVLEKQFVQNLSEIAQKSAAHVVSEITERLLITQKQEILHAEVNKAETTQIDLTAVPPGAERIKIIQPNIYLPVANVETLFKPRAEPILEIKNQDEYILPEIPVFNTQDNIVVKEPNDLIANDSHEVTKHEVLENETPLESETLPEILSYETNATLDDLGIIISQEKPNITFEFIPPENDLVETISEPAAEKISFIMLLDLPFSTDPAAVSAMLETHPELPALPPVCSEVTAAMTELDPEPAVVADKMLQDITALVDEVMQMRASDSEIAPELEIKLEQLCIELFEYLGIEYTPETAIEFAIGIVQTKKFIALLKTEQQTWIDKSMHEALSGTQQTNLLRLLAPFTKKIGSLTLQLTQALAA